MNKRQRKKLQKQQGQKIQLVQERVVSQPKERTRKKTRKRAIARSHNIGNDPIGQFIEQKKISLGRYTQRFDKLIDDYIEEQVAIRRETLEQAKLKVLEVELPPYIDYHAAMNELGYDLAKGELKVIPDLDFMENHYFQTWERAFERIVEENGKRGQGIVKLLDIMAHDIRLQAIDTFVKRQFENPFDIVMDARSILEQTIREYGERYDEEQEKVYRFSNKPEATGKR